MKVTIASLVLLAQGTAAAAASTPRSSTPTMAATLEEASDPSLFDSKPTTTLSQVHNGTTIYRTGPSLSTREERTETPTDNLSLFDSKPTTTLSQVHNGTTIYRTGPPLSTRTEAPSEYTPTTTTTITITESSRTFATSTTGRKHPHGMPIMSKGPNKSQSQPSY